MESTTLFSSESALLLVMFLMVAVGFWLQRFKVFKVLGPALTVIVTASGCSFVAAKTAVPAMGNIESTITNDKIVASNLDEVLHLTLLIASFSPCAFEFCNLIYSPIEQAVHIQ